MIWRFIVFALLSFSLILFSSRYLERMSDLKRNGSGSQLALMSYDGMPKKLKGIHLSVSAELKTQKHKNKSLELIRKGIFWSDYAESFVPKGSPFKDSMAIVKKLRHQHVKNITKSTHSFCGSGKNGIAELEDGTTMCVRYLRRFHYIFAEALAFYLSRLLGIDNVPEVIISKIDGSSRQWKGSDFLKMDWQENDKVAMIKWINDARSKTLMPLVIQNAYKTGKPVTSEVIHSSPLLNRRPSAISELIQWGTLIIFDNLIGHDDRFIHYLPVTKGGRGTRSINYSLFNSIKSPNSKIWLIDNESAFCYRTRHNKDMIYNYIRLLKIHDKMLKTMCVFQFDLVGKLRKLSTHQSAFQHLWDYASFFEPLFESFRKDDRLNELAKLFNSRLDEIILWIDHCKSLSIGK